MEFFEVIESRRSSRSFGSQPVEPEKLERVLATATSAPSAGNLQSYAIFVVSDVKRRAALARAACAQGHVLAAPVNLVFCAEPARAEEQFGARGAQLFAMQDATIACTFAMLGATAVGLDAVWVGSMDEDAVRRVIDAPDGVVPVAILPLGYKTAPAEPKERRSREELVRMVT